MNKISGSCSCGAIQFHMKDQVWNIVNCHCSICRKLTGAAFTTYIAAPENDYFINQGQEHLAIWKKPQSTMQKHFCRLCGSPMYNTNPKYGNIKIVYMGTLEKGHPLRPKINIYCNDQLKWLNDLFEIENFPEGIIGA